MAALRELSGGRGDLLAEVCGLAEGFAVGTLDELRARCAARLCRLAGADEAAIPQWLEEGKRRRDAAPRPALAGFRIARPAGASRGRQPRTCPLPTARPIATGEGGSGA